MYPMIAFHKRCEWHPEMSWISRQMITLIVAKFVSTCHHDLMWFFLFHIMSVPNNRNCAICKAIYTDIFLTHLLLHASCYVGHLVSIECFSICCTMCYSVLVFSMKLYHWTEMSFPTSKMTFLRCISRSTLYIEYNCGFHSGNHSSSTTW